MSLTHESLSAPVREQGNERRREARVPVDIPARVKSLDPVTSIGPSTEVRITNISRHGLRFHAPRPYLVGALVQIVAEKKILLGRVRYCLSDGAYYDFGVQLVDIS